MTVEPITRTIGAGANGTGTIVDEMLIRCTLAGHGLLVAGVGADGPAHRVGDDRGVVGVREDLVAFERIYWDQASLLAQLGVLDTRTTPILGAEQGAFLTDPDAPLNELLERSA